MKPNPNFNRFERLSLFKNEGKLQNRLKSGFCFVILRSIQKFSELCSLFSVSHWEKLSCLFLSTNTIYKSIYKIKNLLSPFNKILP